MFGEGRDIIMASFYTQQFVTVKHWYFIKRHTACNACNISEPSQLSCTSMGPSMLKHKNNNSPLTLVTDTRCEKAIIPIPFVENSTTKDGALLN